MTFGRHFTSFMHSVAYELVQGMHNNRLSARGIGRCATMDLLRRLVFGKHGERAYDPPTDPGRAVRIPDAERRLGPRRARRRHLGGGYRHRSARWAGRTSPWHREPEWPSVRSRG